MEQKSSHSATSGSEFAAMVNDAAGLIRTLQEVSDDSRRMARDLADSIIGIADIQCDAIDLRIRRLQMQLKQIEDKLN